MMQEIELMKKLGSHENLLSMVGYVKLVENPVIATEYCVYGDLLKILRQHPVHYMVSFGLFYKTMWFLLNVNFSKW
jgi:serine/threonine protein kinase